MSVLLYIDVPDLEAGERFHVEAFGLAPVRRFGAAAAELGGWPVPLYLLEKAEGTIGAGEDPRRYRRHWTPIHFDVMVDDVDTALARALAAGAVAQGKIRSDAWGRIVTIADPFGHGICLVHSLAGDGEATTEAG